MEKMIEMSQRKNIPGLVYVIRKSLSLERVREKVWKRSVKSLQIYNQNCIASLLISQKAKGQFSP